MIREGCWLCRSLLAQPSADTFDVSHDDWGHQMTLDFVAYWQSAEGRTRKYARKGTR